MNFAKNLKQEMKIKNVSQNKMSKETGIGQSTISDYVSGKKEPTLSKAKIIADYLKISLDRLAKEGPDYIVELDDGSTIIIEKENRPE